MKKVKEMSDDALCDELMYWFRVGRKEGMLKGDERKHFQKVCNELRSRGLLKGRQIEALS